MQRRSRDAILGAGSSCIKQPAVQTKTCNMESCPDNCLWWEFLDGKVFKGIPDDSTTKYCYDDTNLLPPEAQQYFVGMGSEYIDNISPVKSVCGACILFTTLEGKVGEIFVLHIELLKNQQQIQISIASDCQHLLSLVFF